MESLSPDIGSKGVTENKPREHELSFHPHFIYEEFTSLYHVHGLCFNQDFE